MMRKIKIVGVIFLSAGWLCPAYFSTYYLISWLDDEVSDLLRGNPAQYSFDFLLHLQRSVYLTFAWFSAAVLFWVVVAAFRLFPKKPTHTSESGNA